ncbi:MAG: LysR family transcriptional regulator, partial [Lachnospiraceae bacterium]|nr:LysR family transcriptional regulator [Lachnospiraceae bacterium]
DLEQEFGKQLFIRGKRKLTLTDDGLFLRKRAEEIVSLAHRTAQEMKSPCDSLSGDIYIGAGESVSIRNLFRVAQQIQSAFPEVHFHLTSGDSADLVDRLDKGLFDFCVLYGEIDQSKYEYMNLPYQETWGLLMQKSFPLAAKQQIEIKDLWDIPLIMSRQIISSPGFFKWLGKKPEELNITNTYNLAYNGALMVEEGMGCLVTLDGLVNTLGTDLCFQRIEPERSLSLSVVWKKYQTLSRAAEKFITELEQAVSSI